MQFKTLLPAALAVAGASAQSSMMNLTSLISSNSNLSALGTLLHAYPNITTSLANATNVTLFAPNNNALMALNSSMASSGAAMSSSAIQALLMYHVLHGTFYAENITSTPAFPHTLLNNTMYSNVTGGQVVECRLDGTTVEITSGLKSVANVTQANLNYTGGVVHVIDSVLTVPENFSSTASVANLTSCLGAADALNLTSTLDMASDITIFAPNNAAFQSIGSGLANLSTTELTQILEYHVLNGTIAYSSLLTNASVPTMDAGHNVTITVEDGAVFVNSARVINADILISGGVMHVIDSVLNPNSTNATRPNASNTAAATAFSGASSVSDVPYTSGVPAATTTVTALVATTVDVASGYSAPPSGSAVTAGGAGGSSHSSSAFAAPTQGALGAAALFGGAAFLAQL